MLFLPFLPFFFLFLISCSDDVVYNEAAPRIFFKILNNSDTVLVGQEVSFQAVITPSPDYVEYLWIVENKNSLNYPLFYPDLEFKRSFNENGLYNIKFYVQDHFFDIYRDSLLLRVSSLPVCKGLSVKIFQGSPIFKWNCMDKDSTNIGDSLTYKFSLFSKYGFLVMDTTLTKDSLQLGYALQKNDVIRLVATNKYGFETHLDSTWSLP
ncbi:MAG: hypothetical protein LBC64_00285 [Fibromonadaceae bacterium]|nr:hypothetical protein [Fibromonadaceae bacterium]